MPIALLNQRCGALPLGPLALSGANCTANPAQRIDVRANADNTHVDAFSGAAALALLAAAGAAVNLGLIAKDTQASLGAIADARDDIVVDAESCEDLIVLGLTGAAALLAAITASANVYVIAPQTRAILLGVPLTAPQTLPTNGLASHLSGLDLSGLGIDLSAVTGLVDIHAQGDILVSAQDHNDVPLISGAGGIALLAAVGAVASSISVVKTTLAFVAPGAIVTADGAGLDIPLSVYTGAFSGFFCFLGGCNPEDDDPMINAHGLVVQAVSYDNLLAFAGTGGAALGVAVNGAVTLTTVLNITRAWIGELATINVGEAG